jgi:hypothetical protein
MSVRQLVAEVKGTYAGLVVMVESKCMGSRLCPEHEQLRLVALAQLASPITTASTCSLLNDCFWHDIPKGIGPVELVFKLVP